MTLKVVGDHDFFNVDPSSGRFEAPRPLTSILTLKMTSDVKINVIFVLTGHKLTREA